MKPTETVALCRIAHALFPAQHFDDHTPDLWFRVLDDLRFVDCEEAVYNIGRREKWCEPSAIRQEVRNIRHDRIAAAGPIEPPPGLDELEYRRWFKRTRTAIADGEPPAYEVGDREMPSVEGVFREMPDAT